MNQADADARIKQMIRLIEQEAKEKAAMIIDEAKQKMERVINDDVCRDIGGDEQRVLDIQTAYSAVTFKHVLLPVWAGAYRLQGKVYQVVVNGRTSEVMGDRPYSVWKILFACLLAAIALGIFATVNDQSHSPNGNNSVYQSESSYPGNG